MKTNKQLVAEKIQRRINELGISRKQFAAMMCVKPPLVTRWLSGNHNFTIFTMFEIERVLKIELFNLNVQPQPETKFLNEFI
jgi:transcriptional regulator with XRE-family HTH domain